MRLDVTSLVFWKTEHNEDDNEDASAEDQDRGLFTVADGVGETSFSYQWAPILARRFLEEPLFSVDPFEVEHWVRASQEEGQQQLTSPESLEGIAKTKARLGASSTLTGLGIIPCPDPASISYSYKVIAIGDSNFFHWRYDPEAGYSLIKAFPIVDSKGFGTLPDSINSRTFDRESTKLQMHDASADRASDLRDGDVLMLATDAVAQWVLRDVEAGGNPMIDLLQTSSTSWPGFIEGLRKDKKIVNDDSTVLIILVASTTEGPPLESFPDRKEKRTEELWSHMRSYARGKSRDLELSFAYGDGSHIGAGTRAFVQPFISQWRARADAYKKISDSINIYLRHTEQKDQLEQTWQQVRDVLLGLHWTQGLIATLRTMGVEKEQVQVSLLADQLPALDILESSAIAVATDINWSSQLPDVIQASDTSSAESMYGSEARDSEEPTHPGVPVEHPVIVDNHQQSLPHNQGKLQVDISEQTERRNTLKDWGKAISRMVLGDDSE